jgi:pyruvate-formate lyase-activating enzyme
MADKCPPKLSRRMDRALTLMARQGITPELRHEMIPHLERAKSFDELPSWIKDIVLEAEQSLE